MPVRVQGVEGVKALVCGLEIPPDLPHSGWGKEDLALCRPLNP
jgi:hypothetical protein